MREAYLLLEEGAQRRSRSTACSPTSACRSGPFGMQDIAGIDVGARIRQYLASIGKTRAEGPQSEVPDRLFDMGRYGQKTGAGWYQLRARQPQPHPRPAGRAARRGSGGQARHHAPADQRRRDPRADHDGARQRGRAGARGRLRPARRATSTSSTATASASRGIAADRCSTRTRWACPTSSRACRSIARASATTGSRRRCSSGWWRRAGGSTPLARHLRGRPGRARRSQARSSGAPIAAGLQELFARLPEVDGVVVRVGEAGPLFNRARLAVLERVRGERLARRCARCCASCFPCSRRAGKLLVLRTWTVRPGRPGRPAHEPGGVRAALGDIDSPSLVVSTKYRGRATSSGSSPSTPRSSAAGTGGSSSCRRGASSRGSARSPTTWPPRTSTRCAGPARTQPEHRRHLALDAGRRPRCGRGRSRSIRCTGSGTWIDANVYATSRLAADPAADVGALTRDWVAREIAADPEVVDAVERHPAALARGDRAGLLHAPLRRSSGCAWARSRFRRCCGSWSGTWWAAGARR